MITAAALALLKTSIVLGAAWFAASSARRRSASLRHWLLASGVVATLVLPLLTSTLPAWHLWPAAAQQDVQIETAFVLPASPAHPGTTPPPAASRSVNLTEALAAVWLLGSLAVVTSLLAGIRRLRRLTAAAGPAGGAWTHQAQAVAAVMAVRRPVRWLESTHPALLVTWGLRRPTVLLPSGASGWPEDRIRMVVAHELAHVRRGDWATQLAGELLRAVWWFNPLVAIVCRRLRLESELACDDEVLRLGESGPAYAEVLLSIARSFAGVSPELPALAIVRPSHLRRRVGAMLNPQLVRRPLTLRSRLAAAAAAALVAVPIALAGSQAVATLSGTIVDPSGRPVAGADVVLKGAGDVTVQTHSDAAGAYRLSLVPGSYQIEASRPGFRKHTETVTLASGGAAIRNLSLEIGTVSESITVTQGAGPRRVEATASPTAGAGAGAMAEALPPCTPADGNAGGQLTPPRKVLDVRPVYPAGASAGNGQEITMVTLQARIGVDGTVVEATPVRSPDPALEASALTAVRQWRFTPTLLNCQPVETDMTVTVTFKSDR